MKSGHKTVLSLSYKISKDTMVYPGDPELVISEYKTLKTNGSNVLSVTLGTHTATHLDAGSHIIEGAKTLTDFGPEYFFGIARCLDLTDLNKGFSLDKLSESVKPGESVFIHTGHGLLWGKPEFYKDWPVLDKKILDVFVDKGIKSFGVDTPSVDPKGSDEKTNHKLLLERGMVIYENLANLNKLSFGEPFVYFSNPLLLEDADGFPVNVVALTGDRDLTDAIAFFKKGIVT